MAFYYIAKQKHTHKEQVKLTTATIRKLVAANIVSRWNDLQHTIEICINNINQYNRVIEYNSNKVYIT